MLFVWRAPVVGGLRRTGQLLIPLLAASQLRLRSPPDDGLVTNRRRMGTGGSDVAADPRQNKTRTSSIEERTAEMNKIRQWWIAGVGVAALVTVIGAGAVMAQTPSSTPSTSATPTASASTGSSTTPANPPVVSGTPASTEDAAHEANETAEQE